MPITLALVAALALVSCGDLASPTGEVGYYSGPDMVVEPREVLLGIGNEASLAAEVRGVEGIYSTLVGERSGGTGIRSTPGVVWRSSNASIVAIGGGPTTTAVGLSEGKAELTASFGGLSATIPVTVRESANPLVIADFHLLEEPQGTSAWSYAPKLRLASATQRPATAILGWEVSIPSTGSVHRCRSHVTLFPGVMFELFGEAYGDYAYSFSLPQGPVPPKVQPQIRIKVQTADGGIVVVRGSGAVVPVTQPPAYSGSITPQLCLFP